MTTGTYGDFARWTLSARHGAKLKSTLDVLSLELASGQKHDLAKHLGVNTTRLSEIDDMLERLSAFKDNATTAETTLKSQQIALSKFDNARLHLANSAVGTGPNLTESAKKNLSNEGTTAFETMVAALNTRAAGRYVFAGAQHSTRPLDSATAILNDLKSSIDFTQSTTAIASDIETFFSDPGGAYAASHYHGDTSGGMAVPISADKSVNTGSTALDEGVRDVLARTAVFALLTEIPSKATQEELVAQMSGALNTASGAIDLQAKIGIDEAMIETERAFIAGEKTALSIERNKRVSADQLETATHLKQAEIQLQVHYTMLSRMSQLSLVNFA